MARRHHRTTDSPPTTRLSSIGRLTKMVDEVFLDVGDPSESVGNVLTVWFVVRRDDRFEK